jgi:exopolysaccharide biosynthesis polyprenyl glycosylphosphotransferase
MAGSGTVIGARADAGVRPAVLAAPDGIPSPRAGGAMAAAAADGPVPAVLASAHWWTSYATRILLTDAIAVLVAVFTAYVVRFETTGSVFVSGLLSPSYLAVSVVLMWAWIFVLVVGRTQDRRLVGVGPAEYQRVCSVTWRLFAGVAVVAYLGRMEIGRGYLGIAFPLGLGLLLVGRWGWRQWLRRRRDHGEFQSRVLVVGHDARAAALIGEMRQRTSAGFGVVGVCVPPGEPTGVLVAGLPVLGTIEEAAAVARANAVDAVTVVASDAITPDAVRRLGWDLEGSGIDLALAISFRDVAGPRVLMQPVNGLPLVYVDEPQFTGAKYLLKSVFDWVGAVLGLVAISPVLVTIAALIKITSPGPVLYRQERVGVRGTTFGMLKFRSMDVDAHERLADVLAAEGVTEVGLFYKPKNDPRVTPLGRVLRKYSLDELPQLLNVLRGEMSLVGPRPQIPTEVALYDRKAHRRLLVKPGLTGLWQVSGRSDLTPEAGIRMDVYYVENWTLFGDLLLVARTVKTIMSARGAV